MYACKYCNHYFSTRLSRIQHLRQKRICAQKFRHEIAALASRTKPWHVDDPEELPSDMEGHQLDAVDDTSDGMEGVDGIGGHVGDMDALGVHGSAALFQDYLAAVTGSKSQPMSDQATGLVIC
jgi:hypothetical protein